jgi:uncharacterized protein YkwD
VRAGALAVLASAGPGAAQAAAAACPGARELPAAATRAEAATAIVCVLNEERARRDLARLREQPQLERAAAGHARDMVRRRFFAHTTPEGTSMVDRLRGAGYIRAERPWAVGESLAWGAGGRATPAAIVAAWLDSPPHRRLVLAPRYREVGIGLALGVPVDGLGDAVGATYAAELGVRS